MKILMILLMLAAAFLFGLLHDTLIGQAGCWVIGGLGVFSVAIIPKGA
jgi:hypothetical protein